MGKLIIICGISFAGKSTLGQAIARRFGHVQVDVDDVKVQLYGPVEKDDDLSHDEWVRIYSEADKLMAGYLRAGRTVIDASRNFRKAERQSARAIAAEAQAEVVTIFVDTPEDVARKRLHDNRKNPSRVDFTDEEFEHILQAWEPPGAGEAPIVFRYGEQIEDWIARNASVIC